MRRALASELLRVGSDLVRHGAFEAQDAIGTWPETWAEWHPRSKSGTSLERQQGTS